MFEVSETVAFSHSDKMVTQLFLLKEKLEMPLHFVTEVVEYHVHSGGLVNSQ